MCHGDVHNCVDEKIATSSPRKEEDAMTSSYISEESEKEWELESPRHEAPKPWLVLMVFTFRVRMPCKNKIAHLVVEPCHATEVYMYKQGFRLQKLSYLL